MRNRTITKLLCVSILLMFTSNLYAQKENLEKSANKKITELQKLVKRAKGKGIDVSREESTLWMADKFLDYAKWDEQNIDMNTYQYSMFRNFKDKAEEMAVMLPNYERSEVINMLDSSLIELKSILSGDIKRRDIPKIDWTSIKQSGSSFISNGKPVFINDYFTKTPELVNEYCGMTSRASLNIGYIDDMDGTISSLAKKKVLSMENEKYSGYVLLWHGAVPSWAKEKYGDMTKGRRYFTHYDIDNPNIRNIWSATFKAMVPLMAGKPYTDMGYILSNEPHWFSVDNSWAKGDISDYTYTKFKKWLEVKHKDIATLNRVWGSNFASFNDIEFAIPFSHSLIGSNSCYDWQRFNMDRVTDWFTFLDSGVKMYDPNAKTHLKIMPHLFSDDHRDHGLDMEQLTELTDIIGNDAKITKKCQNRLNMKEYWDNVYSYDWRETCMTYDFCKSVSPNKPNINSEGHFISSSQYRDFYTSTDYTNSTYWLAALHGMNICFTWFWAREGDAIRSDLMRKWTGDSAMNSSYAASVCTMPRVANQLSRTMMELTAFGEEVTAYQNERRPIRIFYSETSALKKKNHLTQQFKLYESLFFEGLSLGFATERIIDNQDNSRWDMILVSNTEYVTDSEFAALQQYVDNGGTVIIDRNSLTKNEYGSPRKATLGSSKKGRVINLDNMTAISSKSLELASKLNILPKLKVKEANSSTKKGCLWRVIPYKDGGYMLTLINLGNTTATIELELENASIESITDLNTGTNLNNKFTITPEKVMLLQII